MYKLFFTLVLTLTTVVAAAFPTKVKVLKEPNLASSEGIEVVLTTNKGTITASHKHPVYKALGQAKKGQCLMLETESESTADFNRKVDASGVNSVSKTKC